MLYFIIFFTIYLFIFFGQPVFPFDCFRRNFPFSINFTKIPYFSLRKVILSGILNQYIYAGVIQW